MKIRVSKQTQILLSGAMLGSLLGALVALVLYRRKRSPSPSGQSAIRHKLPLGRVLALVMAVVRLVRDIIDFADEGE